MLLQIIKTILPNQCQDDCFGQVKPDTSKNKDII